MNQLDACEWLNLPRRSFILFGWQAIREARGKVLSAIFWCCILFYSYAESIRNFYSEIFIAVCVIVVAYTYYYYVRYTFRFNEYGIQTKYGVFSKHQESILAQSCQRIETTQTLLQRVFGLTTLYFYSSSSDEPIAILLHVNKETTLKFDKLFNGMELSEESDVYYKVNWLHHLVSLSFELPFRHIIAGTFILTILNWVIFKDLNYDIDPVESAKGLTEVVDLINMELVNKFISVKLLLMGIILLWILDWVGRLKLLTLKNWGYTLKLTEKAIKAQMGLGNKAKWQINIDDIRSVIVTSTWVSRLFNCVSVSLEGNSGDVCIPVMPRDKSAELLATIGFQLPDDCEFKDPANLSHIIDLWYVYVTWLVFGGIIAFVKPDNLELRIEHVLMLSSLLLLRYAWKNYHVGLLISDGQMSLGIPSWHRKTVLLPLGKAKFVKRGKTSFIRGISEWRIGINRQRYGTHYFYDEDVQPLITFLNDWISNDMREDD